MSRTTATTARKHRDRGSRHDARSGGLGGGRRRPVRGGRPRCAAPWTGLLGRRAPVAAGHATDRLRAAAGAQLRRRVGAVRVRRPGGDTDRGGLDHAERDAERGGHAGQHRGRGRVREADGDGGGQVRAAARRRAATHLRGQQPVGRPPVRGENHVPELPATGHDRLLSEHVHSQRHRQVRARLVTPPAGTNAFLLASSDNHATVGGVRDCLPSRRVYYLYC